MSGRRERGAALIVAMLVAAIAAAIATTLTVEGARWQAIVQGRLDHARAESLAAAGVQWARQALAEDAGHGPVDHLGEPWAVALPPTPVDGGSVEGRIEDAQGRLNLNAIGGTDTAAAIARDRLARLFTRRGVDPALVDAIADWVDPDSVAREHGAEDEAYARDRSVAANAPMSRVGEIVAIRGVTPTVAAHFASDVAALPVNATLNVNTVSADVLAILMPSLDADAIAAIVAARAERPFTSIDDFRTRATRGTQSPDTTGLGVGSGRFLVTVRARQGDAVVRAEALLAREGGVTTVVWQVHD